jgi:hypothetical protein
MLLESCWVVEVGVRKEVWGKRRTEGKKRAHSLGLRLLLDEEGTLGVGLHRRKRVQNAARYNSFRLKIFTVPTGNFYKYSTTTTLPPYNDISTRQTMSVFAGITRRGIPVAGGPQLP